MVSLGMQSLSTKFQVQLLGDHAIVFKISKGIKEGVDQDLIEFSQYITDKKIIGIKDIIVAYDTLTLIYDILSFDNNPYLFANKLLENHLAFSKIFDHIGKMAISDVRFLSMDLKSSDSQKVTVSVKGLGKNLPAVAFQSDVLSSLEKYGVSTIFSNPVIQSPSLDSTGAISFGFSADVDRNSLLFKTAEQK